MGSTDLIIATVIAIPIALSIAGNFLLGGCKFGRLEKRVELMLTKDNYSAFFDVLKQRLNELGFRQGDKPNEYLQGSKERPRGPLGHFTHAVTLKSLTVSVQENNSDNYLASLKLTYLDPIVADTGESAYRDAVLHYVSGQCDSINIVPNRSFMAVSAFIGGIFGWIALFTLRAMHFEGIRQVMIAFCGAYATAGVLAIIGIVRKRHEITGLWLAVIGTLGSIAALLFTLTSK